MRAGGIFISAGSRPISGRFLALYKKHMISLIAEARVETSRGGTAQSWRSAPLRWLPAQSRWRARKAPQGALHLKRKREPEIRIINHEDLHLLTHPGGDRHDRHFAGARPTAGRSRRRLAKSRCQNHRR